MFSFLTAREHRGEASSVFTLSEAASRGILWKKMSLMRRCGAATRVFIRKRHFFETGVTKPEELLSTFQKKQKNEFISVKLVIYYINFL